MAKKSKFAQFVNDVNWLKVGFFALVFIAVVIVVNKLFGRNGIIAQLWGGVKSGAAWTADKIGESWNYQMEAAKQGVNVIEDGAKKAYELFDDWFSSDWDF